MAPKRKAAGDQAGPTDTKHPRMSIERVADIFAVSPDRGEHVKLIVGEGEEQASFHVPMEILIMNSPVFAAMFERMQSPINPPPPPLLLPPLRPS